MDLRETYAGSRVLITGNTGFKGSWLSAWLKELGADVMGYSLDIPTEPSLFTAMGGEGLNPTKWGDVADYETLKATLNWFRPDFVFHLAAQPIVAKAIIDPLGTWRTNCLGSAALLQAIVDSKVQDIATVIITSDKVYKNLEWPWGYREVDELGGFEPYGLSKAAVELVVQSYLQSNVLEPTKSRVATVRAGNVIGGGDWAHGRLVPDAARAAKDSKILRVRSPLSTRPWQHVLEPISGYLQVGASLKASDRLHGEAFNFGPEAGTNYSVSDVLSLLATELRFQWHSDPETLTKQQTLKESTLLALSSEKAKSRLGWKPYLTFEKTVEWTAKWYAGWLEGKDASKLTQLNIMRYSEMLSD